MTTIKTTYKILAIVLIAYCIIGSLYLDFPYLPVIGTSIRNIFSHVSMWFAMIAQLTISLLFSIRYLKFNKIKDDIIASKALSTGIYFGIAGVITGMAWAKYSWGDWWVNDPKLTGSAITLLSCFAYLILRNNINDEIKKARISAVYNILLFAMMIVLLFVLPRTGGASIHPGQSGNPVIFPSELNWKIRLVLYPSFIGWILLSIWLLELKIRLNILIRKINNLTCAN